MRYGDMTKAQRLVIIDEWVRDEERVEVSRICAAFEISDRAVYRDVSHLNEIGRNIAFGGPACRRFIRTVKRSTKGSEE